MNPTDQFLYGLALENNVGKMVAEAEKHEIGHFDVATSPTFYHMLALGYLIQSDAVNARYTMKRCPHGKDSTMTDAVNNLIHALWNKDFASAFKQASHLNFNSDSMNPFTQMLQFALVERVARLHASVYTSPNVAELAKALNADESQVSACLKSNKLFILGSGPGTPFSLIEDNTQKSSWKNDAVGHLTECSTVLRKPVD